MQLGSGDRDSHRFIAVRIILKGCGFRTGFALLDIFAGFFAAANVSAAFGSVDGANSRYTAVHIHLGIDQIVVRTVICLTRRIGHGLKLAGAPDEVVGVPLIAVIEIDILPVCNRQASALVVGSSVANNWSSSRTPACVIVLSSVDFPALVYPTIAATFT